MKWQQIKNIAANRTEGKWGYLYAPEDPDRRRDIGAIGGDVIIHRDSGVYGPESNDAKFILTMANNFERMAKVVDAARELVRRNGGFISDLAKALEELEK